VGHHSIFPPADPLHPSACLLHAHWVIVHLNSGLRMGTPLLCWTSVSICKLTWNGSLPSSPGLS
jgi:hypothetical protein